MCARHLQHLHVLQAFAAHQIARGLGAPAHLLAVEPFEAHAGNPHELLELREIFGLVGGMVGEGLLDRLVVDGSGRGHGGGP